MARPTQAPEGHGEILCRPAFDEWAALADDVAREAASWSFSVGGMNVRDLRALARRESVEAAREFSARLGVPVIDPPATPARVALTGHQPELYHTGVWSKVFWLQLFAESTGATPIDLVVDSDTFTEVALVSPCATPDVVRCREVLLTGEKFACHACVSPPDGAALERFRAGGSRTLETLGAPHISRNFLRFCDALEAAQPGASDVGELVVMARRRVEASAGTDYLELPVTAQCRSESFRRFFVGLAGEARHFAIMHNEELSTHRRKTGIRSAARPFPDLGIEGDMIETPFWAIVEGQRTAVWLRESDSTVFAEEFELARLPEDPATATRVLAERVGQLAPRAIALTMFSRLLVADLFIHGLGGERYDQVTNRVIARLFGIEAPPFAVASLTARLQLPQFEASEGDLHEVERSLHRLQHNPDQMLDEASFRGTEASRRAEELAAAKAELVEEISMPDADKKAMGERIRTVNAELAEMLSPLAEKLTAKRARLLAAQDRADVLTDRTYPFCLWDAREVLEMVRRGISATPEVQG